MISKEKIGIIVGVPLLLLVSWLSLYRVSNYYAVQESMANGGSEVLINMTKMLVLIYSLGMLNLADQICQTFLSYLK